MKKDLRISPWETVLFLAAVLLPLWPLTKLMPEDPPLPVGIFILVSSAALLLLFFLVRFFAMLLHETGHLVCGLASGFRFSYLQVWPFRLSRLDGRFKLSLTRASDVGLCGMFPPEAPCSLWLYYLGGVLANGLGCLLGLAGFLCTPPQGFWHWVLLSFSLQNLALALINGLPLRFLSVDVDGLRVQCLLRSPFARQAQRDIYRVGALFYTTRLRDMPEELFYLPQGAELQNRVSLYPGLNLVLRTLDQHRFAEAASLAGWLEAKAALSVYERFSLRDLQIYCALLAGADIRPYETPGQQKLLRRYLRSSPSVVRTQYARALLWNQNPVEANALLGQFERLAKNLSPMELQGERELIAIAYTAWLERTGQAPQQPAPQGPCQ